MTEQGRAKEYVLFATAIRYNQADLTQVMKKYIANLSAEKKKIPFALKEQQGNQGSLFRRGNIVFQQIFDPVIRYQGHGGD